MFSLQSFLLAVLVPNVVFGAKLLRVEIKTADQNNANMILGTADLEIFLPDFTSCRIISLNNGGVNFQQGVVDVFEGSRLESCQDLEIPNKQIGKLTLIHSGTDGWIPEYVALIFDDSTFIQCPDNQGILDNSDAHDLFDCGPVL